MKFHFKNLVLFVLFFSLTVIGYATGNLSIEESNWIEAIITFLESIDLNALHATAAAILGAILMLLRMFQRREKSGKLFKKK